MVSQLKKHRKRWHTVKYTGYQCNVCGTQASSLDRGHMRQHMSSVHGQDISKFNAVSFEVKVPEGYYDMYQCKTCEFRAFTEDYIKKHVCHAAVASTKNGSQQASGPSISAYSQQASGPSISTNSHQASGPSISTNSQQATGPSISANNQLAS
jgi:hypothetical protein